jgi:hypothetical protein
MPPARHLHEAILTGGPPQNIGHLAYLFVPVPGNRALEAAYGRSTLPPMTGTWLGFASPIRISAGRSMIAAVAVGCVLLWAGPAVAAGGWSRPEPITPVTRGIPGWEAVCATASLCLADDGEGDVNALTLSASGSPGDVRFSLPIPTGSGDDGVSMTSLQCPAADFCAGVGDQVWDSGNQLVLVVSTSPGAGPASWREDVLDQNLVQLSCPSAGFCAAVTDEGTLATSVDPPGGSKDWHSTTLGTTLGVVDCPSASFCIGLGHGGRIWTSTDPTGGAGAWSPSGAPQLTIPAGGGEAGGARLSCAGPSLCVAASTIPGEVLVSTDPAAATPWSPVNVTGLASIDSPEVDSVTCEAGTQLCLAGTTTGEIASSTDPAGGAGSWTRVDADNHAIHTLSCSASTCIAADGRHAAVVATVPAAGSWHWTTISERERDSLLSVSCPSATECVAPDDSVYFSSSDPGAGARTWRGHKQTNQTGDDEGVTLDGACYSRTLCLAVVVDQGLADVIGGQLYTYDPVGGAHRFRLVSSISFALSVACAQRICVAGLDGSWYQSSDPARAASWRKVSNPRFDVYCLTRIGCVGLADGPFAPLAGPDLATARSRKGPWRPAAIDPGQQLTGLSCPSRTRCYAVDAAGRLLTSTHPTGGPGAWHVADDDPDGLVDISCPSVSLCVAADGNGAVLVRRS